MRLLSYLLTVAVATVPMLWIEEYAITNPICWTVVASHLIGRLFGYFEGLKKEKDDDK